ncbi:MAG: membrane protein insertion efficiency factor YidD [Candidatus Neomarinimicrobiota bacterium]
MLFRLPSARAVLFLSLGVVLHGRPAPADTLLYDTTLPLSKRIFIAPIILYQRLSYKVPLLNCQFEPSCSSFMVESISRHGVAGGLILGADRIVRCNPWAFHYHLRSHASPFSDDGPLLDPVPAVLESRKLRLDAPLLLLPGFGRVRAGRTGDGLVSCLMITSLAVSAHRMNREQKPIRAGCLGILSVIFWLADIKSATEYYPHDYAKQKVESVSRLSQPAPEEYGELIDCAQD